MYPSIDTLLRASNPSRLLEVRRAIRSNLGPLALLGATVLLVVGLSFAFPSGAFPAHWPVIGDLAVRWTGVFPAIVLLEMFRRYHDDLYVFGTDRVTHYEGRLSLKSSVPSLKYSDIKAIMVEQTLIGRVFNYGNVALDSSAQDGAELTVSGVISPIELSLLIEELRAASRSAQSTETRVSP